MAFDTVVDGSRLASAMTATADAIREKAGHNDDLTWDPDTGFQEAVSGITTGGMLPVQEKDVNFFDYDGTLLHSYTIAEAQALTELPPLPSHDGLVCQGWNWTLEEITALDRPALIGPNYNTTDGSTRLHIDTVIDGIAVTLNLYQFTANDITIDWGDGSTPSTYGTSGKFSIKHVYTDGGKYDITLSSAGGRMEFGDFAQVICTPDVVLEVNLGAQTTQVSAYSFNGLERLECVSFSQGNTFSGASIFDSCRRLRFLALPKNVSAATGPYFCRYATSLFGVAIPRKFAFGSSAFQDTYALRYLDIPDETQTIPALFARSALGVTRVFFPPSVTSISANAFASCSNVLLFDFTRHTAVPTLSNISAFTGINAACEIRVPASLYADWGGEANWATYADNIVGV